MYGKDAVGLTPEIRKTIERPEWMVRCHPRMRDRVKSLDAIIDLASTPETVGAGHAARQLGNARPVGRPTRTRAHLAPRFARSEENAAIPGMEELWARIDELKARIDQYSGKAAPDEYVLAHPIGPRTLNGLRSILIELRRQQYVLRESYYPTIPSHPQPPTSDSNNLNLDEPTGYYMDESDWCARHRATYPNKNGYLAAADSAARPRNNPVTGKRELFWTVSSNVVDLEDPVHIYAIMQNYATLLTHSYSDMCSTTRLLCMDFETLVGQANLDEVDQFILEQTIARRHTWQIADALAAEGVKLSDAQVRKHANTYIPTKLAKVATEQREQSALVRGEVLGRVCSSCGQRLPLTNSFFYQNKQCKGGFAYKCIECARKTRVAAK